MFDINESSKIIFNDSGSLEFLQDKVCPRCKTSLSEVLRNGIVGCANCYRIFEQEIRERLLSKQGSINHVGKVATKHISKIKIKEKIAELEKQKEIEASKENFIAAETLKNQIEKLKGELGNERL